MPKQSRTREVVLGRGELVDLAEKRCEEGGWLVRVGEEDRLTITREMCFILQEQVNDLREVIRELCRPDPPRRTKKRG